MNDLTRRTALIPAAVLALAAPMAEAAPASTPSQDCVIAITADVPGLTIGRDVGTQLRIGARGLTPGAAPQLTASAGTVDDLKPDGEGGYVASYYAPLAGPPQVAIVSAISGKDCGYLALRLSGEVNAVVRARPNVPVDVRMGDEVFGPVRADASGRAVVPVVIPPGVRAVTHGTQRVPVEVPWTNHLLVVLDRASARADRDDAVTAHVFATSEEGAPAQGKPTLSATHGEVSAPEPAGPGAWRARWRLPKGRAEASRLDVRLGSRDQGSVTIERAGGPPTALRLTVDRDRTLAGDKVPVLASVRMIDEGGNGSDSEFQVEAEPGRAGTPVRVAPGHWRVPLEVPSFFGGRRAMAITARAGQLSAKASVALVPGPPASLKVEIDPDVIGAGATGRVSITVADASGNPVEATGAATPTAEAAHGEVGAPAAQGPGRWVLSYTPPGSRGDGQDYVRARMGSLTGSGAVRLTAAGSTWVIAPKAGFAMRSGGVGPYAGLEVAAWKELAGQELGLTLEGVWWNFSDKSDVAVGGLAGVFERSTHYFGLLASVGWRHRLGSLGMLWAGAGGGMTRVSNDWSITGQAARKDLGWAPVVTGAVSAGLRAWRGYPFLELRVSWVRDPHIISLSGALVPITLSAGYRFDAF